MSNVCPKCGYSGDNLIVDEGVSEYMVYMTCRMCNSSTTLEVSSTVKEFEDNSVSDNTSLDGKIDEEEPSVVEDDKQPIEEIPVVLHTPKEVCPKCGSKHITQWTRIIGYLRPIKGFSKGRRIEAGKRVYNNC